MRNHPEQTPVYISLENPARSLLGTYIMPWDTVIYLKSYHASDWEKRQEVFIALQFARRHVRRSVETATLPEADLREDELPPPCGCGGS